MTTMTARHASTQLAATPARPAVLQRKCACDGSDHECEECKKKGALHRKAVSAGGPELAPPIVHEVLRSRGEPLDTATTAFMEAGFGHDFSRVRVHADRNAAESAAAVNALAYTSGRALVFGSGQYAPKTKRGLRLLAHELAHVVQQSGTTPEPTHTLHVLNSADSLERDADDAAAAVTDGRAPHVCGDKPAVVARQAKATQQTQRTDTCLDTPPLWVTLTPLDPKQQVIAGAAEIGRSTALATGRAKLQSLANRILAGDPELKRYDPNHPVRSLKPSDADTIQAVKDHLSIIPESFDTGKNKSARTFLEVIRTAIDLFDKNAALRKPHVARSRCEKDTFACATTPMRLCPIFFGAPGNDFENPLCPTLVLTHEYFHYLMAPSARVLLAHGETVNLQAPEHERRLANAFSLSSLALQLAFGTEVSCE